MTSSLLLSSLLLLALASIANAQQLKGNVSAVYDLLDRVLPGSRAHFNLSITNGHCSSLAPPCFTMSDGPTGAITIIASSASELTSAIGVYFREFCNMTIGWPRGGGSNIFLPSPWPPLHQPFSQRRTAPWSYMMNVCTHSYSLVWYDWAEWQAFIDWMALSGINHVLAMTGQEEVQYKVFSQFGLSDQDIRTWFNGPAFLTWSRGQNEAGNDVCGPLPRSWMKAQWDLQRLILARYRSLGIVGQLPGFQGNVPIQLKAIWGDENITQQDDTGWMYSTDPLFGKIADVWMKTLIEDFGTDHWYQLDGYFNGGTAPWYVSPHAPQPPLQGRATPTPVNPSNPPCQWSRALSNTYLEGCAQNCKTFTTVDLAKSACAADSTCGGITVKPETGLVELRVGISPRGSSSHEVSYVITNEFACHRMPPDPVWLEIGTAAYNGLSRTDPDAIWSFQGWAIIYWETAWQASQFEAFAKSAPVNKFVVIDMSVDGSGEWTKWDNSSFFGVPFIWTTLHDFGGTDGIKGDLARINAIPFNRLATSVIGTGFTPEGIDQNPIYYEFMAQANFRTAPVSDIVSHAVLRAHRRYRLTTPLSSVTDAWTLLANSAYTEDLSVQDNTGVPHLPGSDTTHFSPDRHTPVPKLCMTFQAWEKMLEATAFVDVNLEPFRYDLINLGREILAQLSTPMSQNLSTAYSAKILDGGLIKRLGDVYTELLLDLDTLVGSDPAFLLGPWIEAARRWGANASDCLQPCPDFYEWNARVQITTWHPTQQGAKVVPGGVVDYASKHWSGLIRDYYKVRAERVVGQALADAAAGRALNTTKVDELKATLAYTWTTATNPYPVVPQGDAVALSKLMYSKYKTYYSSCL